VISPTCSSFSALQLMSTTSVAVWDSTTSNAVTTPPARPTAIVRSPAALAEAGTSTRAVIAYPGPGTGTPAPYRRHHGVAWATAPNGSTPTQVVRGVTRPSPEEVGMTTATDPAPTTVPAASTVPSAATTRPRRVDGLGTATAVLLGLSGLAYASSLYVDWSDYRLLSDHVSGRITGEEFWAEYSPFAGPLSLLLVAAPFAVAAAVVLLVWVHRARTNAGILS